MIFIYFRCIFEFNDQIHYNHDETFKDRSDMNQQALYKLKVKCSAVEKISPVGINTLNIFRSRGKISCQAIRIKSAGYESVQVRIFKRINFVYNITFRRMKKDILVRAVTQALFSVMKVHSTCVLQKQVHVYCIRFLFLFHSLWSI